eukprot:8398039-Prorocentrum_lima.AAC.1
MRQLETSFQSILRAAAPFVPVARDTGPGDDHRITPELRLDILRFILVLTYSDQLFSSEFFLTEDDETHYTVKLDYLGLAAERSPRKRRPRSIPGREPTVQPMDREV